jgi:hypothetical protein
MASINTLVNDINQLLREDKRFSKDGLEGLKEALGKGLETRLGEKEGDNKSPLRMSNLGSPCDRKLWYTVNRPDIKEDLQPRARLTFLYGEIVENLILALAKEAGHRVEGVQDEVELEGILGHRDAVIDGVTVDIKSANSRMFQKFSKPVEELKKDIWFASYIDQLQLYMEAGKDDPLVTVKKAGAFIAFDKEMGHITTLFIKKEDGYRDRVISKKETVASSEPPNRGFNDEADGASGNRKLCTYCSYCQYKRDCWPGLRTFVSSSGPKFLTKVSREPNLLEVK